MDRSVLCDQEINTLVFTISTSHVFILMFIWHNTLFFFFCLNYHCLLHTYVYMD